MDADILYEFARNQVYGSLSRAIEGLRQNSHGLLAQEREKIVPEFANDAFFYRQVLVAHDRLQALEDFCTARCAGQEYYEARRDLMDKFEGLTDKPFSDEDYAFFPPSYMDPMPDTMDAEKESAYRWRHLDEFRTTMHVLDAHLRQGQAQSWSVDIIFKHINDTLDSFKNQTVADKGFGKFPAPSEMRYLLEAVKWLQERTVMSSARANVNICMDTTGLPGIFGKVTGNSLPEKMQYAHYSQHCENMAASLVNLITTGEYLKMLRTACGLPVVNGREVTGNYNTAVAVNLPQALADYSSTYLNYFIDSFSAPQTEEDSDYLREAVEAGDAVVADFLDEFINDEKRKPAPAHKPWACQELKL